MTTSNRYIHSLQIGSVRLENNLALAPMAGFTNVAFRLIARQLGNCGLVASEMVAALSRDHRIHDRRFREQTRNLPEEHPIVMQIYGRDPDLCGQTARDLDAAGADIIDLNCGCPVRKAKNAGCGVALMRDPDQVGQIVAAMCATTAKPVTVKMRLGFDEDSRNAIEVAQAAISGGAVGLCVHARTGETKHGQAVDLAGFREVREAVPSVPVLINGDMDNAAAIRRAKDEGGADGYMIGRAACGDPWLFRNLNAELTGQPIYTPTLAERRAALEHHFDLILDIFGEKRGCLVMRKYTFFYCQGLPGVRRFREHFMRITSRSDFVSLVDTFFGALRA